MSFDSPALLAVLVTVVVTSLGYRLSVGFDRHRVKARTTRLLAELDASESPDERG